VQVVDNNPQVGKIATLTMVRGLFRRNPLCAGYGNRDTDTEAYKALSIQPDRIYM
jgi:phosphatidate phosphatase PAH1